MGFLDDLKDRFLGNSDDDYYDDDYDDYDDDFEDEPETTGLLGNTRRPEADSVSVYTRSGRPLNEQKPAYEPPERRVSYDRDRYDDTPVRDSFQRDEPVMRISSGQLPPYVLHATAYDEVQSVVRRVRTNQPVVLVLKETDKAVAQRIIDFCYGLSFGINGAVEQLGDFCFAVLPAGINLTQADVDRMTTNGTIAG